MKIGVSHRRLSRKYLRLVAVYRRAAERNPAWDYSADALMECFLHESEGKPVSANNGYAIGKKWKDVTIAQWREDIAKGDFCKAEFVTPLTRWYAEPALSSIQPPTWFPYEALA